MIRGQIKKYLWKSIKPCKYKIALLFPVMVLFEIIGFQLRFIIYIPYSMVSLLPYEVQCGGFDCLVYTHPLYDFIYYGTLLLEIYIAMIIIQFLWIIVVSKTKKKNEI